MELRVGAGIVVMVLAFPTAVAAGPLEPGLEGRDDILLWEDFEDEDWPTHWTWTSHPENNELSTREVFDGSRSLIVSVPAGEHYGQSMEYTFANAGEPEPEELYFRYYVRFSDTWEREADGEIGKLPGFGGTYNVAGWGGNPSDGTNGWSARMMNWDEGPLQRVGFYTYHADMMGTYGDHMPWEPDQERERWICIETHARVNTITDGVGNPDGVLEGWIDDQPAFSLTDLRMRHIEDLLIEKVWFNVYVGGNWTADHDMHLYFDNVVVAENRIGCYDETGPSTGTGDTSGGDETGPAGSSGGGGDVVDEGGSSEVGGTSAGGSATGSTGTEPAVADGGDEGCSCGVGGSSWSSWAWVLVALGLRRRRPRRAA